jgi:hypothetical protein
MEGQYCRLFFACQRGKGYAYTHGKKGPPPVAEGARFTFTYNQELAAFSTTKQQVIGWA